MATKKNQPPQALGLEPSIWEMLSDPFPRHWIQWKPIQVSSGMALAAAYVDARRIAKVLTKILGLYGWQETTEVVHTDDRGVAARCQISISVPGPERIWITRGDFGEQPVKDGESIASAIKGASTDAFKRAAVKFGVGAYLYFVGDWVPYDPSRRKLLESPPLPDWALPKYNLFDDPESQLPSESLPESVGDAYEPQRQQPPQQSQGADQEWNSFRPRLIARCKEVAKNIGLDANELYAGAVFAMKHYGWREPQPVSRAHLNKLNEFFEERKRSAADAAADAAAGWGSEPSGDFEHFPAI
jgi:hypothetical protein